MKQFNVWIPSFLIQQLFGDVLDNALLELSFSSNDALYLASLYHGLRVLSSQFSGCSLKVYVAKNEDQCKASARVVKPRNGGSRIVYWLKRFIENDPSAFDATLVDFLSKESKTKKRKWGLSPDACNIM